jgi:threonyl-tRNA synthetase
MLLTLKDGSKKEFKDGLTGLEVASEIAPSLGKKCVAYRLNGELYDYREAVSGDGEFEIITKDNPEALHVLNHTAAHVLAQALLRLYPDCQLAFGPAIEEGFYYDVLFTKPISDKDFPAIEAEMKKIVEANYPLERKEISKDEAKAVFKNEKYKLIHAEELQGQLSIYKQGEYVDLCKGPHVASTGLVKAFKLMNISGAYFKGDKNSEQLTRIYGVAFFDNKALEDYLKVLEERKQSDHRKIGKDLGLFMISDYGPGFPFWLPNGNIMRRALEDYWLDFHYANGYEVVRTPMIMNRELWETSGHWDHYKQNMYTTTIDEKEFAIKPMNCPGAILVYKNDQHSYKDLPIRIAELGLVHRHEASGALNGLFRVRCFTQDDAHILLREDQIESEISKLLKDFNEIYKVFGLSYHIELSTRPETDYIGDIKTWDAAENALRKCLGENGVPYQINPGDGAFYGPKLDFKLNDSLGRIWQCGTIQLDMFLPGRFDCTYIDQDGTKKTPLMIHRAIFGSIERFTGILIEHFKGAFPTWLAPHQVEILPVNLTSHQAYAEEINKLFLGQKIRSEINYNDDKLGKKIHDAAAMKIPYTLVIGDKEVASRSVTYRVFGSEKQVTVSLDDFIKLIRNDIDTKSLTR